MATQDEKNEREEGSTFLPKFNDQGLLTAMVVDAKSREPLMLAHMNAQAVQLTLDTGEAHFFSRSRQKIWRKGETSGNTLSVKDIRIDCDQDALWLEVDVAGNGAACHTQRQSCFYRRVVATGAEVALQFDAEKMD